MRKFSLFLIPMMSLAAACGGGDDDGTVTPAIDAPTAPVIDAAPVVCSVSTNAFGDKGALTGGATYRPNMTNAAVGDVTIGSPLEAADPTDALFLEFYTGYTPFGTSAAPTAVVAGTYQITGDQLNYATCGVCARIGTNVTQAGYDDDYLATGGTVTITAAGTAVGQTFTASVANLQFAHVTIDETTFESTPVGDGCTTAITAATYTGTLAAPQAKRNGMTTLRLTRTR